MSESSEKIQKRIEQKRAQMGDRIAALEEKILGPVHDVQEVAEDVQETAEETVEGVKQAFNVSRHFRKHPWLMLGGSAVLGYLGGRLIPRFTPEPSPTQPSESAPRANGRSDSHSESDQGESWTGRIVDVLGLEELREQAIAESLNVLKGLLISAVPADVQENVTNVVNRLDEQLEKSSAPTKGAEDFSPSTNGTGGE